MTSLKMIDLFAGTGAFTKAFQATGKVECVFANDMVPQSKTCYDAQAYGHALTLGDLNAIKVEDIPAHDILCGGFPCQPFSVAGNQEGFNDPRSNVFHKILEILDFHKPGIVVLENVKNLVTHDDSKTFAFIKTSLTSRGYHVKFKVLNTAKITGVPQNRERIYIVAFKSKEKCDAFSLDFDVVPKVSVESLLEPAVPAKYYYTAKTTVWPVLVEGVTKTNTVYQCRRSYMRENKSGECPTLTANMGTGGNNVPIIKDSKGIRKLTPRECFRFQGFDDGYVLPNLADSHLYKLAGNAVSLPVVKLIADRLTR